MHTVFVNTTKNRIGGRFDPLKSLRDLKKLMYVDCPLDVWNDEEIGFKCVAQQIADFIDTYNYVDNDFNLIVYADMVEVFDLLKIGFFDSDDEVYRSLLSDMCKRAISRLVSSTLLDKLTEEGRKTLELPVLLLELPETKEIDSGIDTQKRRTDAMLNILHLAPMELLGQKLPRGEKSTEIQVADILDETKKDAKLDFCTVYQKRIQILMDSVCKDGIALQRACDDLYKAIEDFFTSDCAHELTVSEYYSNKKTQKLSLEANTKHNFLLQCFILDCVDSGTVFNDKNVAKQIPELSEDDWKKIKETLYKKKRTYEVERNKITNLSVDYTTLGLAPELFAPARKKFGLNESGNVSNEYVFREAQAEQKKTHKNGKQSDNGSLAENSEEIVEQTGVVRNWFEPGYKFYDSNGDEYIANMEKATAEEYCERAKELANHHLNICNKLNMHIKRTMANYSGRSISNATPILRKRSVNMGENIVDSEKNDYIYVERNGQEKIKETEPTESVIETSKRSYISIMIEYLKFDAGRGIAMKSIKKQCDWFINRIRHIEKSLKKLLWISVVLSVVLALVYLPFLLIQWHSIVKNVDTVLAALMSLATPYLLLYIFYFIARELQKRKMKYAWEALVESSKAASSENRQAIAAYDALLTRYIPALRWIYEYVLDVDFHCDCCDIARAKLAHHRDKLFELIENLGNFLEDLDYSGKDYNPTENNDLVEYVNAFCEGKKNSDFYSIIDKEILDIVHIRKERA